MLLPRLPVECQDVIVKPVCELLFTMSEKYDEDSNVEWMCKRNPRRSIAKFACSSHLEGS
jgi:hypothetical protein